MSAERRLSTTLGPRLGNNPRAVPYSLTNSDTNHASLLQCLCDNVYFFPLEWRKFILDFCRIQASPYTTTYLEDQAALLPQEIKFYYRARDGRLLQYRNTLTNILNTLECLVGSPIACSVLSYFVRAESTHFREDFLKLRNESWNKEFLAATESTSRHQVLDYSALFGDSDNRLHPQLTGNISPRLKALYKRGITNLRSSFSRDLHDILLPSYNDKKNVGYQTQDNYFTLFHKERDRNSVTTLDLLRLYTLSGTRVWGPLEMRQAWFFNDLKPRTYYCTGGDAYFVGLYIQQIANRVCEILPSTNPFSRFEVSRVGPVFSDQILITYDYSSFTSSLSELKYFLHWLGLSLRNVPVDVYDTFRGIMTYDLGDMILDYNEAANKYMAFSVERFDDSTRDRVFFMSQSGALGVKGNIVFSTSNHGVSLADITSTPDQDCCVGDDALARILAIYLSLFITCVNNLGEINDSKFQRVLPLEIDPILASRFKFLKRPLSLDQLSLPILGILDFFPDVATIFFPKGDGIHSPPSMGHTPRTFAEAFVKQVCRFSKIQRLHLLAGENSSFTNHDSAEEEALRIFQECYEKLGLEIHGQMPGWTFVDPITGVGETSQCFVPPVDSTELFKFGWVGALFLRFEGEVFETPMTAPRGVPPMAPQVGERFLLSTDFRELSLLEALGYVEKEVMMRTAVFDEKFCSDLESYQLSLPTKDREAILAEYTVKKECPHWDELFRKYQLDSIYQDDLEKITVVSSFFSE